MKRVLSGLLAICLVLSLAACNGTAQPTTSQKFDQFLEELPAQIMSPNSMDLEFAFQDPSQFGIDEQLHTLPFLTQEQYDQDMADTEALLARMEEFPYAELTKEQQLTYDVLADTLDRSLGMRDFYLYENNYLGAIIGFQSELPILLDEYTFDKKLDIDSYLNLCNTAADTFRQYAQMERTRQEAGVGYSQELLDEIIKQASTFAAQEDLQYLLDSFYEQLDAADFLTLEEKEAYRAQAPHAIDKFRSAYQVLADELSTIEGAKETLGLPHLPQGKEYYAALIRTQTGLDMTPEEIQDYLDRRSIDYLLALQAGFSKIPDIDQKLAETPDIRVNTSSVEETLEYLYEKTQSDFPALEALNYRIKFVPEAMQENFSPAAYLTSRVDTPLSDKATILINGEFDPSIYTTLAHEGYPGHMYQDIYFKSTNPPTIRKLLSFISYTEGWAVYIEGCVADYAQGDPEALQMQVAYNHLNNIYMAMMDIGVNYIGWTLEDFNRFCQELFGEINREAVEGTYRIIVENPTYYLKYMLSAEIFTDLRNKAENALGDEFDPREYHQVILKTGPCSFPVLESQVNAYLDSKNPAANRK